MPLTNRRPHVAVIGAGAAGLTTAKALLDEDVRITVLEKGDRPGGLWVQGNASGLSPAYDSLHLNTSKGRTEFAGGRRRTRCRGAALGCPQAADDAHFDHYVNELPTETQAGVARARRGAGTFSPTTHAEVLA
jgi:cation diffusion facilitator CzcD-associated flavoprotein CzcO